MALNICYVARNDLQTKPGGDTVQWQMYRRTATEAGMRCSVWLRDEPLPKADVYHAFNIDRPLEIYPRLHQVVAAGRPFVLSAIHHPHAWVQKFRQTETPSSSSARLLYRSPIGSSLERSESLKELVRLLRQGRARHFGDLWPKWRERIQWLLSHASTILLLSEAERRWIEVDFQVASDAQNFGILPNWVDGIRPTSFEPPPALRDRPIIVLGRIEARKNIRRVARVAHMKKRRVVFVGRANPNETLPPELQTSPYVTWIPGVPREQIGSILQHAGFLLNASYVEVSPLVDIEALAFGCHVVTTTHALHHEFLPANTPTVDPYSDDQIGRVLAWEPSSKREPIEVVNAEQTRRALLRCYAAARG